MSAVTLVPDPEGDARQAAEEMGVDPADLDEFISRSREFANELWRHMFGDNDRDGAR